MKTLQKALKGASREPKNRTDALSDEQLQIDILLEGRPQDRRKLIRIVNEMCRTPSGRTIIEAANEAGYALCFDRQLIEDDLFGYAEPNDRICALNPDNTMEESIVTMAHELRHAFQFENKITEEVDLLTHDTKTNLHVNRIMEADAEAYGCLVAWDMKEKGHAKTWNLFADDYPEIVGAFERALLEDGDRNLARTQAFLGWYDSDERRDDYDADQLEELRTLEPNQLRKKLKSVPVEDIVAAFCHDPGTERIYFTEDPRILDQGKPVTVYEDTKKEIQDFFERRSHFKGHIPDASIDGLETIPRPKEKSTAHAVGFEARRIRLAHEKKDAAAIIRSRKAKSDGTLLAALNAARTR